MRRLLLIPVVVILLAGCGGGSANNNPFAGSWSGNWSDATAATTGTLSLIISNNGSIAGTVVNTTSSASDPVTGTVNSGGLLKATFEYTTPTTEQGYVVFGPNGQLQGSFTETSSGAVLGTAVISLIKQ